MELLGARRRVRYISTPADFYSAAGRKAAFPCCANAETMAKAEVMKARGHQTGRILARLPTRAPFILDLQDDKGVIHEGYLPADPPNVERPSEYGVI